MNRGLAIGVGFIVWLLSAQFNRAVSAVSVNEARALIDAVNAREGHGLDPAVVLAVIEIESAFDPQASRWEPSLGEASLGLMQLLLSTAKDRGLTEGPMALFDPARNIQLGMRQLAWSWDYLVNRLGRAPTDDEWIGSYNAGVGNVTAGYIPDDYVRKFQAARARYA